MLILMCIVSMGIFLMEHLFNRKAMKIISRSSINITVLWRNSP